tara:strand:+ start:1082 stop:1252 length:171 start_codon:yes stop_codon:yes gene_type:complete
MGLDQLIPVIFLLLVLVLILPAFLKSNSKLKQLLYNLFIWSIIIVSVVIVSSLILK